MFELKILKLTPKFSNGKKTTTKQTEKQTIAKQKPVLNFGLALTEFQAT